jgi:hypothetical protein
MFSKILSAILICALLAVQACAPIRTTREEPIQVEEAPVETKRQFIKGNKKFVFTGTPATPAELARQLKVGNRPVKPGLKVMELQRELWGCGDLAITMTDYPLFVEMDGGDRKRYRGMIPANTMLKVRKISETQELIRYQVVEVAGCGNPVHCLILEIVPGRLIVEKIYRTKEVRTIVHEERENKWNYVLAFLLGVGAGIGIGYGIFGGRGGGPIIPPRPAPFCPPGIPGGR